MTAKEVLEKMKADKCYTMSAARSKKKHRNFSNKYTQLEASMGYPGYDKDGYFTKFYSYGVVGHCAIFVQYWLIKCGYGAFVPKSFKYIFNTNRFMTWLKSEPTVKGYGKVDWTDDLKKAQQAAKDGKLVVTFKGSKKSKKWYTHTCALLKIENGYVYTVDGNVRGTYNGKKINNGKECKRSASKYKWGFAILPIPTTEKKTGTPSSAKAESSSKPATTTKHKTTAKTSTAKPATKKAEPYVKGKAYTLQANINIRAGHSTKSKKLGLKKKGAKVKALEVYKTSNGTYWIRYGDGKWLCAKTPKKKYLK